MKTMSALKATATIGAAIVLALLTVQGTLALWTVTATSKSQSVQAADFAVTAAVGDTTQRVPDGGTVTVSGLSDMKPGECRVTPIRVTNATNAGGSFTVKATVTVPKATGTLAPHLVTGIGLGQDGSCTPSPQTHGMELAKKASGTFYLSTKLAETAPAAMGGAGASIAFTLTTEQQSR
jgi:predicted ribosomally synthesized peptide with SipW-like signal peptide